MHRSLRRRALALVTGVAVGAAGLALSAIGMTPAYAADEDVALSNPGFQEPFTAGYTTFSAAGSNVVGLNDVGWKVVSGTVDVVGPQYWAGAHGSTQSLDLNGNEPGKVCQSIASVAGAQYAVDFSLSRNGGVGSASLRASAEDGQGVVGSVDYTHSDPWSPADPGWVDQGLVFLAREASTKVCFAGLTPAGNQGAAIDDVVVTRLNQGASVTIANPSAGERFFVGQQAAFAFACSDPDDGPEVVTCTGILDGDTPGQQLVDPGDPIPTAAPGVHTLTVTAEDDSDQQESQTISFSVVPTTSLCRGTGARLLGLQLGDANPPTNPCLNRTAYTAIVDLNLGPATIPALANKVTLKAPKGDTVSAPGFAQGRATVAEAKVKLPTLGLDITALAVQSSVTSAIGESCATTDTVESSVAKLVINGKTTLVGDGPLNLPLLGGIVTIKLNEKVQTAGVWTARALVVDLPGTALDVVIGESTARTSCPPVIVIPTDPNPDGPLR